MNPGILQEVLLSVGDLDASIAFWREWAGWDVQCSGDVGETEKALTGVAGLERAESALMAAPGKPHGHLRLLKFHGVSATYARPSGMPWDTGAVFDIDVRVRDVSEKFEQLSRKNVSSSELMINPLPMKIMY